MGKKKFSDLPATTAIGASDLLATSQVDLDAQSGYKSKKITGGNVARSINVELEYQTDLDTDDKTVIGAINEVNSNSLAVDSASGAIASFNTALAKPLKSCLCTITPTQSGSGTPSPSNPRPLIGIDTLDLVGGGINLWDEEYEVGSIDPSTGVNIDYATDTLRAKNYIPVVPNISIRVPLGTNPNYICWNNIFTYDKDKNYLGLALVTNDVVTIPSNCFFIRFRTVIAYGTTYNHDISINYPSSDTDYHAYHGTTYAIDLNGTRYGGYVDVVRGKLVVTHGIVDLSTLNWSVTSLTPEIQAYATGDLSTLAKKPINNSTPLNAICSTREVVSVNAIYANDNSIAMNNGGTTFSRVDGASTPPTGEIAYELATPIEVDLSAVSPIAIEGVNNWFSNGNGNTDVEFYDTIQNYVDKKIAELQALILQ